MTDKEIIIDGVDILGTIDDWADTISQKWNCNEYSTAKIIKSYILDINKQLQRKEQECEELKETINKLSQSVILPMTEPEIINLTDRYKQALEKIEEQIALYQAFTISKPRTMRENDCLYKINDILNEVLKCN